MDYQVVLFYKYIPITDPESLMLEQKKLGAQLGLKGRMIIAKEGINGTFEGTEQNIGIYVKTLSKIPEFADINFKYSSGNGQTFPKLSIKVRNEIVAYRLGENDIKPWEITGQHLMPEQLHHWFETKKQFYILDMRNDFEQKVGFFENSLLTNWEHSENLPSILEKLSSIPKEATIVTVCTGGVRCEKASGFLVKHGFTNVYQLTGGIHSYIEKYPGQNFKGALYTFDKRLVMGFNLNDPSRIIVGKCANCQNQSENLINCSDDFCHRHFIACLKCLGNKKSILCPMGCRDYSFKRKTTDGKSVDEVCFADRRISPKASKKRNYGRSEAESVEAHSQEHPEATSQIQS